MRAGDGLRGTAVVARARDQAVGVGSTSRSTYNGFRAAGKPVLLYFSDAPAIPSKVNREQYEQLEDFRQKCEREGLVERYASIAEIREKVARHLTQTVQRLRLARRTHGNDTALSQDHFGGLPCDGAPRPLVERSGAEIWRPDTPGP